MPPDDFLSRAEILGGLPAKRARTLLFLIENRVGLLAARANQAMDLFSGEEAAEEIETAFLEAYSSGREPPQRPTIRDLERFAQDWVRFVPDNLRLRAALAHLISEKYVFTRRDIPQIRAGLGLEQETVQLAYQNLYNQPLAAIYRPVLRFPDKVRWTFSRLGERVENLPPFWTAFSLTLTETVGAAILALPIALARVGPLASLFLLVFLGLVNVATIGFMAEVITRSATMRYGNAYLGQVMADYLGPAASIILSLGLGLGCFLFLQAYYIGVSTTLADATGIPPGVITMAMFAIGTYYLSRKSLTSTIASALAVGAVNMSIILFISVMAFGQLKPELFKAAPPGGKAFDFSLLELIFGVILAAYFGHLSICNCGKVVLRRDPSGRSLIQGSMAAMSLAVIIYSIWVLAVNGAIEPASFEGLPGTVLTPLASKIGPIVLILGSVFVVLGMGMASVHFSLGIFNMIGERMPSRRTFGIVLPRRSGRIIFHPRGRKVRTRTSIGLTYLGLKGSETHFLLEMHREGEIHREEIYSSGALDLHRILNLYRQLHSRGFTLSLEVDQADPEFVRLRCATSLAMTFEGDLEQIGIRIGGILELPDAERTLLNHIVRGGELSLDQAAARMGMPLDSTRERLKNLAERGFIREAETDNGTAYRPLFAPKRTSTLPGHIWEALDKGARPATDHERRVPASGILSAAVINLKSILLGEPGRFVVRISPIMIAFLLTEWMFYTGKGSFSGVLNFLGVIVVPLLGGIFPVLLLASSRRKGEYIPGTVFHFFGHPVVLTAVYLLFLASLFMYGLFIWRETLARAAALFVGIFIPALTIWLARRNGFVRRTAIELRRSKEKGEDHLFFKITRGGEPFEAEIKLAHRDRTERLRSSGDIIKNPQGLESAIFHLPPHEEKELKILAHTVMADGSSSPLEGSLEVSGERETRRFDLKSSKGSLLMPIEESGLRVAFIFPKPTPEF